MNPKIQNIIQNFSEENISQERRAVLKPLTDYIQKSKNEDREIRLNFICTHNSRRSHLSQVWAQAMAHHFKIKNVFCYSGGTEATAMFPKVGETLEQQGFNVQKLSENTNPVYAVKFDSSSSPVICFSKRYDDAYNPQSDFCAIMTCSNADQGCPFIAGAGKRIPVKFEDPKEFDGTDLMNEKYAERSLEIAQQMWYAFSKVM